MPDKTPEARIKKLEKRVDDLERELKELKDLVQRLRYQIKY
jgi:TolA-binding protein